jgi:hypothetical protein
MHCDDPFSMPKSHTELVCWQLADELRQLIIDNTGGGTPAGRDERFTSNLRDAVSSACRNQSEGFYKYKRGYFADELAKRMDGLCGRAMIANLRWLQSLDRPDPEDGGP